MNVCKPKKKQQFQNRNKNSTNDTTPQFSNNTTSQINIATSLPWKTSNTTSNNSNINSNLPSYLRLGNQRNTSNPHHNQHGTSDDLDSDGAKCMNASIASSKDGSTATLYRSSVSDLGYNNALAQITNTRIKSITKRRGAVKYQKYAIKNAIFHFSIFQFLILIECNRN